MADAAFLIEVRSGFLGRRLRLARAGLTTSASACIKELRAIEARLAAMPPPDRDLFRGSTLQNG